MNMVTTITTEVTGTPHRRPLTHPEEVDAMLAERAALAAAEAAREQGWPCCEHAWYEHMLPEDPGQQGFAQLPRVMREGGCLMCGCRALHADGEALA